jgi:predicted DNA-binding transcriptional regulator AlpA
MPKAPPPLLTPHEAAAYLRQAVKTLANWRVLGSGPRFVKYGRSVRYRQADIDAWLAEKSRTSTSDQGTPPRPRLVPER